MHKIKKMIFINSFGHEEKVAYLHDDGSWFKVDVSSGNIEVEDMNGGGQVGFLKHEIQNEYKYMTFYSDMNKEDEYKLVDKIKKAIIMMGLPLSGKTQWINNNIDLDKFSLVSADKIKESHPDYNPKDTTTIHEFSVKEAENMLYRLAKEGVDIIMDGGGINNSYTIRIITKLKEHGYRVKLVHIKTPYTICLERNKYRERKVPTDSIIDKAIRENSQYHRLLEFVDKSEVVDYFTNKNIFVDMDGVIAAMSTLPIVDGEIDFVNAQVHKYPAPVIPVIDKLNSLNKRGYNIYIMSAIPNSISFQEKNEWLDKHFNIPHNQRYFVNQGIHKAEMLDNLSKKLKLNKKDMTLVEDIHSILYSVKNRGMNALHVSEFLTHTFK